MRVMSFRILRLGVIAVLVCVVAAALGGCDRTAVIRGVVEDVSGETLPGVAVAAPDAGLQAVADGRGNYRLRCPPGPIHLTYIKTGYTTGHLTVTVPGPGPAEAPAVTLWPLPPGKGIYRFSPEFRYHELTRAKPQRYVGKETGPCFGVKAAPGLVFEDTNPMLMAFRTPSYDVRLCRLERIAAARPQTATAPADLPEEAFFERVWAPAEVLPVHLQPVDEPEKLLYELRLLAPLDPGVYAVHWGALEGHAQPVEAGQNVFLFRVRAAGEEELVEGEAEGEPETGAQPSAPEPDPELDTGF